jgi:hypothetical protein
LFADDHVKFARTENFMATQQALANYNVEISTDKSKSTAFRGKHQIKSKIMINYNIAKQVRNFSSACYLLLAGFLLGLFFSPEYEGDLFLRNVG